MAGVSNHAERVNARGGAKWQAYRAARDAGTDVKSQGLSEEEEKNFAMRYACLHGQSAAMQWVQTQVQTDYENMLYDAAASGQLAALGYVNWPPGKTASSASESPPL